MASNKFKIKVKTEGLDAFISWLDEAEDAVGEAKKLLKRVGRGIVDEIVMDAFKDKKSPEGTPWKELTEKYRARKGKDDILVKEGNLRKSVGFKVKSLKLYVGAGSPDIPYAAVHQFGYKKKNIPERAYLPTKRTKELTEIMDDVLSIWLKKTLL